MRKLYPLLKQSVLKMIDLTHYVMPKIILKNFEQKAKMETLFTFLNFRPGGF